MPEVFSGTGSPTIVCKYCEHTVRKGEPYSTGVIHWDDKMCGFCIKEFYTKLSRIESELSKFNASAVNSL